VIRREYPIYNKRGKANWIGHILCRSCVLKQVIEEKIEGKLEVTGRGGRRMRQLLEDLKKREDIGN